MNRASKARTYGRSVAAILLGSAGVGAGRLSFPVVPAAVSRCCGFAFGFGVRKAVAGGSVVVVGFPRPLVIVVSLEDDGGTFAWERSTATVCPIHSVERTRINTARTVI